MSPAPLALSLSKGCPSSFVEKGRSGLRQARPERLWAMLLAFLLLSIAAPAFAQKFPQLTGRVVDDANLLDPQQEADLTQRLEAVEQASSRQLVVATVPDLQGYPIEDFGYRLGRAWGIGQGKLNNGVVLLVARTSGKCGSRSATGLSRS
jgi:uncharacterized protein